MNSFLMSCRGYLIVNQWESDGEHWATMHDYGGGNYQLVMADTIGEALDIQFGWDDEAGI